MGDPFSDPRAFRWVESGVSGLARPREWDLTALVELPELETSELTELDFEALPDGTVRPDDQATRRFAAELDRELRRPYGARAVRQGARDWILAGRELRSELLRLPPGIAASSLGVAVSPEGERSAAVDGEPAGAELHPAVLEALLELERRGRERFEAFVARADKVGEERWELTIDPL